MGDLAARLAEIVGDRHVLVGDAIGDDLTHDEALTAEPCRPAAVAQPADARQVAAVVALAAEMGVPVTARGSGTGLSGACVPRPDGVLRWLRDEAAVPGDFTPVRGGKPPEGIWMEFRGYLVGLALLIGAFAGVWAILRVLK